MKNYNIKNQEQAIRHFFEQMDVEMIAAFLESSKTYQDMEKEKFMSKLEKLFEKFIESGDTVLISYPGRCNNCYKDKVGYTFVGNHSFNYISIIVDAENGTINDMLECSAFINSDENLNLNKKLYIQNSFLELIQNFKGKI